MKLYFLQVNCGLSLSGIEINATLNYYNSYDDETGNTLVTIKA